MSDTHAHDAHDAPHEGPIKTAKQLIWTVVASFVVPIVAIIGLANFVMMGGKPGAGSTGLEAEAVARRIQPIGSVEIKDVSNPAAMKTGEQVYQAQCSACHATGAAGAPKLGDEAAWGPRVKTGYEALLASSLKGKGAMGAQGGGDHSDFEIGRAVVFMANKAGAKFDEPKAPAGAASGAAAEAAPAAAAAPVSAAAAPVTAPAALVTAAAAPVTAAAAPAAAADAGDARVVASAGLVKLYFASGKHELPAQAKDAIAKLAEELKAGNKAVSVSGFHDAQGNPAANAELAKRRATGARDLLAAAGVAPEKITLKKPETTNDGNNAEARRVELRLQ